MGSAKDIRDRGTHEVAGVQIAEVEASIETLFSDELSITLARAPESAPLVLASGLNERTPVLARFNHVLDHQIHFLVDDVQQDMEV